MPTHNSALPWTRTPVEVWEQIIFFAITLDASSNANFPIFDAHCTPSNYLAFKRTCGDHSSHVYPSLAYTESERMRRTLRLICRSWNAVLCHWQLRRRWLRPSTSKMRNSDDIWMGALRIEMSTGPATAIWDPEQQGLEGAIEQINKWKHIGIMPLQRLELLDITNFTFQEVFDALCAASAALPRLQSLSLYIPNHYLGVTRRLSNHFPRLLHLTLDLNIENDGLLAWDAKELREQPNQTYLKRALDDTLDLPYLETLFLFSSLHLPTLTNWHLPNLQHVHSRPTKCYWDAIIYPFLLRHSSTIQSLDLDESNISMSGGLTKGNHVDGATFDKGFWDNFISLQLLRCALQHTAPADLPGPNHPLRYLVDTEPVYLTSKFVHALKTWVGGIDGSTRKPPESIVLYGSYLSRRQFEYDGGEVQELLRVLRWNGTELRNPAGKLWIDPI